MVERPAVNRKVVGSSPTLSVTPAGGMADTQSLSLCDIFRAGSSPALGILSRKRHIIKPEGLTLLRYCTRAKDRISLEITSSCETSNAQTHTEIGSLPKAGHCPLDSRVQTIRTNTRTERIYLLVNGNL